MIQEKEKKLPINWIIVLLIVFFLGIYDSLYLPSKFRDSQESFDQATPFMDSGDKELLIKYFISGANKQEFNAKKGSEFRYVIGE